MKKIKSKKGFTLIEMLACTLTLMLIVLICTTGMNMAMKSYRESLFETNSQMLESTLNTAISDVLRYAYNVTCDPDAPEVVTGFTNQSTTNMENGMIIIGDDEGEDLGFFKLKLSSATDEEKYLISRKAYAESMTVANFQLTYDSATHVFNGRYTIISNIGGDTREVTFSYRTMAVH